MNELEYKRLREMSWRRKLTAEEEIRLQPYFIAHPEAQAETEDDAALTAALEQLPNAPLSSNFTAQVLQLIDLEEAAQARRSKITRDWRWWINHLIPRVALGVLTVSLGALGLIQYQKHNFEERAQNAGAFSSQLEVAAGRVPAEMWQDFEAIRRLNTTTVSASVDDELLAALK
jgi:anti-sigma factor RsiW